MTHTKQVLKAILTAAGLAFAGLGATQAAACQGVQFESRLIVFNEAKQADVPEGMVQYRVRVTNYSLRNVYQRDLIHVQRLADDAPDEGEIDRALINLKLVKPVGTSCDYVLVPEPGIYYVTGTLVTGEDGKPVMVNGGALFRPYFTRRKAMDLLVSERDSQAQ